MTMSNVVPAKSNIDIAVRCTGIWKVYGAKLCPESSVVAQKMTREAARDRGAFIAVRGVSFEVRRGEIFCIMGLSGSGKSTVLRHVNRLIEPSHGGIVVEGQDVLGLNAKDLRRLRSKSIGMVFQNVALMPHKNVRDNVAYGLKVQGIARAARDCVAEEKLDLVRLGGWGHRYPHELSGGMQQRVGLARALASDPSILLLDEPFSALDPLIRTQLQGEFLRIIKAAGKTVIFITHDFEEATKLGDRIAIMKDGEFVQVGSPRELISSPADDYVAEFTKGGSGRKRTAKHLMTPLAPDNVAAIDLDGAPVIPEASGIDAVVACLLGAARGAIVIDGQGRPVGTIDKDDLLRKVLLPQADALSEQVAP